jgi:hypothetical protein
MQGMKGMQGIWDKLMKDIAELKYLEFLAFVSRRPARQPFAASYRATKMPHIYLGG